MNQRDQILCSISEKDWQIKVIETAQFFGWKVAHFRPMEDRDGNWRTAVAADGVGFVDLVLVDPRKRRVLFRELKTEKGILSPSQAEWGAWLLAANADYAIWRPSDWDRVQEILR